MNKFLKESSEMSKSDLHKIIDYSEKLQSMIDPNEDLEDWVKAKLTHTADYLNSVTNYLCFHKKQSPQVNETTCLNYKKFLFLNENYKSEMAISDLKNINYKAKILQSKIDPKEDLEDWVKSKLNLAGEYLDDVFHHIDYFDQDGREYDDLNEGFKEFTLAALLSLGTIGIGGVKTLFNDLNAQPTKELIQKIPVNVYIVQKGDNLSDIAKKSNISLDAILKANPSIKNPNQINIGDKIIIPIDDSGKIVSIKDYKPIKSSDVNVSAINDKQFIEYIKFNENGVRRGFDKNKNLWFQHKSYEGGLDTIAYGHKLKKGEDFSKGITESEAIRLLLQDLKIAENTSIRDISQIYDSAKKKKQLKPNARNSYEQLSKFEKQMCLDFAYNIGTLKKFPKFFTALLNKDIYTMKKEYIRTADGKPIKQRNDQFYNYFLKNYE